MKLFPFLIALLSIVAIGCGGETMGLVSQNDPLPKGEGSIPIGCVYNPLCEGFGVTIRRSDGRVTQSVVTNGVITSSVLPKGWTTVEVQGANTSFAQKFSFFAGSEQKHVLRLWPSNRPVVIESEDIHPLIKDGQIIPLGTSVDIAAKVTGFTPVIYRPSYVINGGIGTMLSDTKFKATVAGYGSISYIVGDVKKVVRIQVK